MPVTPKNLVKWPDSLVPYIISAENISDERQEIIGQAVEELNSKVGKKLFIPRTNQFRWAVFHWGQLGDSDIGYLKSGQEIRLNTKWTGSDRVKQAIHEMCHCLGFEHEWFASQYPIAACGAKTAFWDIRGPKMLQKQRTGVATIMPLDANSVMMYKEWRDQLPADIRARFSSPMSGDYLSSRDISAIRFLYA